MSVELKNVTKQFENIKAVDNVSFKVEKGEFFTLLGPSGCGKTTTLRMISGFYEPDEGEIYIDERLVNGLPPEQRNTGFVFQNYALFPHMTVFENVAYGLKIRKVSKEEIKKRVSEVLSFVGLKGFEERYPHQLSGGQQQRVALARVLIINPKVLLLDEPLSNLDAKLRVYMRGELRKIQQSLKVTAIYVTHDQAEALSMSDRIAVMNAGKIEQIGSPAEIYGEPKTKFVADFMGLVNMIEGRIIKIDNSSQIIETQYGLIKSPLKEGVKEGDKVFILIRPESIEVVKSELKSEKGQLNEFYGEIKEASFTGSHVKYTIVIDKTLTLSAIIQDPLKKGILKEGSKVKLTFPIEGIHLLRY